MEDSVDGGRGEVDAIVLEEEGLDFELTEPGVAFSEADDEIFDLWWGFVGAVVMFAAAVV